MEPYDYDDCRYNDDMTLKVKVIDLEDQGQGQILFLADNFKTT